LTRYRPVCEFTEDGTPRVVMVEVPNGEWVKFADSEVAPRSAAPNTGSPKLPTREDALLGVDVRDGPYDFQRAAYQGAERMYTFICRQLRAGA